MEFARDDSPVSGVASAQPAPRLRVPERIRELGSLLSGRLVLAGANAAVMIFLARWLELQTYGFFVLTISAQLLISRFLLMAVDSGAIRLARTPEFDGRANEVIAAGLRAILGITAAMLAMAAVGAALAVAFHHPAWPVLVVAVGSTGAALVDYSYGARLVHQHYTAAAVVQSSTAVFRLVVTVLVAIGAAAWPSAVFGAYHGASLLAGLAHVAVLGSHVLDRPAPGLVRRLIVYSSWQMQANVVVIFSLYEGTFLLTLLGQKSEAGTFGLALTLAMGFFPLYNAYSDYLQARIAWLDSVAALAAFVKKALVAAVGLVLLCMPIVAALAALLPRIASAQMVAGVPTFYLLAVSMLLLLLQAPSIAASHYFLRPQLITLTWVVQAVTIAVITFALAPSMGALGAAIAQATGVAFAVLVSWLVVAPPLRRRDALQDA